MRLDLCLVERKLVESRSRAKMEIESGKVFVNGKQVLKVAFDVGTEDEIQLENALKWVSRGGLKLEKALKFFNVSPKEKIVLDIGSSTGGFSDVVLQGGAQRVYCVDTGRDILHDKIRNDIRVTVFEQTDYRDLDVSNFDIDLVVIDVSFISLEKILQKLKCDFLGTDVTIITLIKPQFEVGRQLAKKYKGVIKDKILHQEVVERIVSLFKENGFNCKGVTESPILGGDGNTEFLACFTTEKKN